MSGSKIEILARAKEGQLSPTEAVEQFVSRSSVKFRPMASDELEKQYEEEKRIREDAEENAIPFISADFYPGFYLSQGLILVGARPGQSKSTTASNVVAGFLRASKKKAVVITNEDSSESWYNRTACVLMEKSFVGFRNKRLSEKDEQLIRQQAKGLMQRMTVIASNKQYDMTCLEDIVSVLDYAEQEPGVGLVVLDYYQTVTWSREENLESFQVLKRLGSYLMEYGRRVAKPVVVFAQLKPKSESEAIERRFQNDATIMNHAFSCIEIIPDFKTGMTTFVVHKERFGSVAQGTEITMRYNNGRYEADGL